MDELIKEINAIPGVECTCFFASNGEVIECSLETPNREQMINAGKIILKLLMSGSLQVEDLISLSICYEESILNARKLKSGDCLVIKHSQATDANLINLTIENSYAFIAQNKTKADIVSDIATKKPPNITETSQIKKPQTNKPVLQSGPLANILAGIQRALTKIEGSEAQTLFKEALIKWSSNHDPKLANLKFLVDILSKELNDQEKVDKFRKMILPYMAYARDN